ncbi:McrB family protein [Rhizobium ruizarguesonis]|uniref:McrB family protein n=1 Tax=Rhizobium ruizarguesonis TaxID=2081791 RepID=UPI001FEEC661|nr:AAA family ATPase [Rhizobium ruizarguesonis]
MESTAREAGTAGGDIPDSLERAFARAPADLLNDLRSVWGLIRPGPIWVVGRVWVKPLPDKRELWFLDDIEHPESGAGLLYPTLPGVPGRDYPEPSAAFIPPGSSRKVIGQRDAEEGKQWAVAELELSSLTERRKRRNPWLLNVRSGTMRPLAELPAEWQVAVSGSESARRISALARQEIEDHVRKVVLQEDEELARRHADNVETLSKLDADRRQAQDNARAARAKIEANLAKHRRRRDEAERSAADLQVQLGIEQERFAAYKSTVEQEKQLMEINYRRLTDLFTEKGNRLVALGLADAEDVAALMPEMTGPEDERSGVGFTDALAGDYARLAPLLQSRLAEAGLLYSQAQLRDFLALLRTRDLIVLAGDSGSGKTSLVRAAAAAIGGVCTVIPVKPNWTGPEDLLGYYNPIERSYQATPFLLALQAAARSPHVPYFICLDEMNLARVEHYFADFLSLLESRSTAPEIHLYTADEERHVVVEQGIFLAVDAEARRRTGLPDTATLEEILRHDQANAELHRLAGLADNESVLVHHTRLRRSLAAQLRMPTSLTLPENVWILGAVNMDDTTHQLSPKVLDRVQVLRFQNPMLADWDAIEREIRDVASTLASATASLRMMPHELGQRAEYPAFDRGDVNVAFLLKIARQYLDPLGVEFGLRAVRQSQGYIDAATAAGIGSDEALDNVVKHKILPKIAFDSARPAGNGRSRRELLMNLSAELGKRFENAGLDPDTSSVADLERMIKLAEGNNGIVNYWLR